MLSKRIMTTLAAGASVLAVAAIGAGGAAAKTCPSRSTSTVKATPSYTYARGCIVCFDGTPIVYNLFEPLQPGSQGSVVPDPRGPRVGWRRAPPAPIPS